MDTSELSLQVKVGVVLVAAVVLGWLAFSLVKVSLAEPTYPIYVVFDNAEGIQEQSLVKKAGMQVGYVERINLDEQGRALLRLQLVKSFRLPRDATFTILSSGYLGDNYVAVEFPSGPPKPGEEVEPGFTFETGHRGPDFNQLMTKGAELLSSASQLVDNLNRYLEKDPLGRSLEKLNQQVSTTLDNLNQLIGSLNSVVTENADEINATTANMKAAAENFAILAREIRQALTNQELLSSLNQLAKNLDQSSRELNEILSDISDITGDPEVKSSLVAAAKLTRETVEEAKKTVIHLNQTLSRVDRAVAGINDLLGTEGEDEPDNIKFQKSVTQRALFTRDPKQEDEFRGDLRLELRLGDNAVITGVDNIGEGGKLTLEAGTWQGPVQIRAGIHRGKWALGSRLMLGQAALDLDLYDPNDVKTNAYLTYPIGPGYRVVFGVEDAFQDNQLTMGLRFDF